MSITAPGVVGPPIDDAVPHPSQRAAATALLGGFGFLMLGNGLQQSLIGVRAESEGFASIWTTLIMASYFAGFLIGTKVAARTLAQVGHIRVFAALASLASSISLLHSIAVFPPIWLGLRFVTGICLAGLFVVVESWLNAITTNATRGRLLGAYMVVTTGGIGLGQLLLKVADPADLTLFILASVLVSFSLIPIALSTTSAPPVAVPEPLPIREMLVVMPAGVIAAVLVGINQGTIMGMGPVFASRSGLESAQIARFLFAPLLGAVIFQYPVGRWSDRVSRRVALATIAAAASIAALSMLVIDVDSWLALLVMFAVGALVFPLYSVSLAYMNDSMPADKLLSGSSAYVFLSGVGAMFGPLLTGALMGGFGVNAYFVMLGGVPAVLAFYLMWRIARRKTVAVTDQGRWIPAWRGGVIAASVLGGRPTVEPSRRGDAESGTD